MQRSGAGDAENKVLASLGLAKVWRRAQRLGEWRVPGEPLALGVGARVPSGTLSFGAGAMDMKGILGEVLGTLMPILDCHCSSKVVVHGHPSPAERIMAASCRLMERSGALVRTTAQSHCGYH